MFSRFFSPKWQHRDPRVRVVAVRELAQGDPILLQVASEDLDAGVRREALRRISDLSCLRRVMQQDEDAGVREHACKRLGALLAGEVDEAPSLARRMDLLRDLHENTIDEYLAQHAREVELRLLVLGRVSRQGLLGDIALNDLAGDVRLAALERIDQDSTLERVARQARGKDKRIARLARERLEAQKASAERPLRQLAICDELDKITANGGVDITAYRRLQTQWQELGAASEALDERYAHACAAFEEANAVHRAHSEFQARQREICERIEQLYAELPQQEAEPAELEMVVAMLGKAWAELLDEPGEITPSLQARFGEAADGINNYLAQRRRERDEVATLGAIIGQLEQLQSQATLPSAEAIGAIEARWRGATGSGRSQPHTAALFERYANIREKLRQQQTSQSQDIVGLKSEVGALLDALEQALETGQLQEAISLHDKVRDRLARLGKLGGQGRGFTPRLHAAGKQLGELRDWRRFATNRAREDLLTEARALLDAALEPGKQASRIKALRDAWRELDRKDGIAEQPLWEAFDALLAQAYAPVKAFHAQQAEQRKANRAEREAALGMLQQALDGVDWEAPAWPSIEQTVREAQQHWKSLGGVEPDDWKRLNKRYRALLKRFETPLARERSGEKVRREALIEKIEALEDAVDLPHALAEVKQAQLEWKPSVAGPRHQEQAMWKRFHAACQAIYARRDKERDTQRQFEASTLAERNALCERLEAVARTEAGDWQGATAEVNRIREAWKTLGLAPKRDRKRLENRFDRALGEFERQRSLARRHALTAQRHRLLDRCALLDCLAIDGSADASAQLPEWDASAELPGLAGEALQRRHAALLAGDDSTPNPNDNLAQRRQICLELELLAGIDSPAEFAEQRLALQVERLPEAMMSSEAGEGIDTQVEQLLAQYCAGGPAPLDESQALHARMVAVLDALDQD